MLSPLFARFNESTCRRYGVWLLLLLTLVLYLPGSAVMPMMDRDEPRFAHATVEMMQRGTWTIPYFNEEYRFDKPPLTYWWMRLHYNLLGINELAARLHSIIATWLVALVIFGIARRLSDARRGLIAGLAWLLTLQVLVHGRLCVADMPMVLFVALAMRALLELSGPAVPSGFSRWHWLLYLSLGCGFLAKGPVALLIPMLALVLYRFAFWRQPYPWRTLQPVKGLLISLAIIAAWGVPALVETGGLFWKVGMGEHVVDRGTRAFNGRFPVPGYYLATALASLFPWIILLPQVWTAVRRQWSAPLALLVSWLLAPYVIFTFYATQLAHYVMPGFPAAVILLALAKETSTTRWHRWWSAGCIGLMLLVCSAATWLSQHPELPPGLSILLIHGALLILLLASLGGLVLCRVYGWGKWPTLVGIIAMVLLLPFPLELMGRDIRQMHSAAQLRDKVGTVPSEVECLAWQFAEPSLVFHFDRPWKYTSKMETVAKHMARKNPTITVLLRREWTLAQALNNPQPARDFSKEVDAIVAAHPGHRIIPFSGFNAARSSWVELILLQSSRQ